MRWKRLFIVALLGAIGPWKASSQDKEVLDSLMNVLRTVKADTSKVLLLLSVADQYENSNPETAKHFVNDAIDLSRRINYHAGLMKSYRHASFLCSYQSKFDSAIYYNRLVLQVAQQQNDTFNIGAAHFNIGNAYRFLYEMDSALFHTLEGVHMLQRKDYPNITSTLYDGLQSLYMTMTQYDKAIEFGEKSVEAARQLSNRRQLAIALNNLGLSYAEVNREADANRVYVEGLKIAVNDKFPALEAMLLNNLSDLHVREGKYDNIPEYAARSIAIGNELGDEGVTMNAKGALSSFYLYNKDFHKAESLAHELMQTAERNNLSEGKVIALDLLSKISFAKGMFKEGNAYESMRKKAESAIFNESIKQRETSMRIRFETEKKETQIKLHQAELQRKNTFNYILIGSTSTLLVISLLSFRNYSQKQKLQQQRISELETEKQLSATEAVLKGEERERTRLARDLHDGLGGLLSGIKYSFNTMKENLVMTPENHQAFERIMDMLDSSIKEMRRVAHNMMPESLIRFGLDSALKDFCGDITESGVLTISFQSFGLENVKLDQTVSITIYRIVQELINNTIKHAKAQNAIVQLEKADGKLAVTVEDDGVGFDTTILERSKGAGWSNIQSRVAFLRGEIEVQSDKSNGTSVHIEVEI